MNVIQQHQSLTKEPTNQSNKYVSQTETCLPLSPLHSLSPSWANRSVQFNLILNSSVLINLIVLLYLAAVSCGDEWTTFEDSKCLRFYDNFETKDVAIQTCASIPSEPTNTARLLSIKSQSEQNFLNTWIFQDLGVLNSVWLDGNRFNGTQFVWADGDAMSFTNWNDGFPTNQTADNLCIDMSPKKDLMGVGATENGKWKDVSCSKRNLVVCEKKPMLTVSDLRDIVFQLRSNPGKTKKPLIINLHNNFPTS